MQLSEQPSLLAGLLFGLRLFQQRHNLKSISEDL